MMTSKEKAAALRKTLKTLGYTARDVSVRTRRCGYSSTIEVTVKKLGVDKAAVEKAATEYEKVDRCEYSGEILMGGNTWVSVRYSDEVESQFLRLAEDIDFTKNKDVQVTDQVIACWDERRHVFKFWKMDETGCGSYLTEAGEHYSRMIAGRLMNENT